MDFSIDFSENIFVRRRHVALAEMVFSDIVEVFEFKTPREAKAPMLRGSRIGLKDVLFAMPEQILSERFFSSVVVDRCGNEQSLRSLLDGWSNQGVRVSCKSKKNRNTMVWMPIESSSVAFSFGKILERLGCR